MFDSAHNPNNSWLIRDHTRSKILTGEDRTWTRQEFFRQPRPNTTDQFIRYLADDVLPVFVDFMIFITQRLIDSIGALSVPVILRHLEAALAPSNRGHA